MNQLRLFWFAAFFSAIIMVSFQNCGQAGQLTETSSGGSSPTTISNSLEIGAPAGQVPTNLSEPSSANLGNDQSDPKKDNEWGFDDISHEGICLNIQASDVLLSVESVEISGNSGAGFIIKEADHGISLNKSSLHLEASASGEVHEINLRLKESGNYLLSVDELVYGLKTPSGQSSGLKIKLDHPLNVEVGREYDLSLKIDLNRQIVVAGKKCLLKPVLRNGSLASL